MDLINSTNIAQLLNQFDQVDDISITKEKGEEIVEATVSVFSFEHHCILKRKNSEIIEYHCDCDEEGLCYHIQAIINKLNELNIDKYPYHYTNGKKEKLKKLGKERKDNLIRERYNKLSKYALDLLNKNKSEYETNMEVSVQDELYELIPQFEYDDDEEEIRISYKVGSKKFLIVKNLSDFLTRIDNHEYHKYGKSLMFVHSEDVFSEQANKQITFIRNCIKAYEEEEKDDYYYYDYVPRTGRYLKVVDECLDDLFDLYYDLDDDQCDFSKVEDKLKLRISKQLEYYTLTLSDYDNYRFSKKHAYNIEFVDNCFIMERMSLDDKGQALQFIKQMDMNNGMLVIHEDQYKEFYKYVLLPVMRYFDIEDSTENTIQVFEEIKVYGDVEDNMIYFQPVYVDENQNRVYGFQEDFLTNYQQDYVEKYMSKYATFVDREKHKAYFDLNSEKTYDFLFEGIEEIQKYGDVYVTEAIKRIGKKKSYNLTMGVTVKNNLLEFDVSSADIPQKEIQNVLKQYRRKKKFYRLSNGDLLYLESPDLKELSDFMDEYHIDAKDMKNGKFSMNQQRMLAIDDQKDDFEYMILDRKKSFIDSVEKFKNTENKKVPIVKNYNDILRDYQKDGYQWMHTLNSYGFNGVLADDMGLGKTLQVIALLESLNSEKASLVVCPTSLVYNWEDEVHKFSKTLKVTCITGSAQTRKEIIENISDGLYVTSYESMRRDYELYSDKEFEYVILDEAQYIKNQKTKNAQSVKTLNARHKLALTGTPIENSLAELWSIFDFLMPQYLFNYHYFQKQYETPIVKNSDEERTKQLKRLVDPFILRRNKKDVLTELPDKIEQNLMIPFSEEERKVYIANLAKVNQDLRELYEIEGSDKLQILKMLTRLRQLCLDPRLLYEDFINPSSKVKACMDLLKSFKENNQKVLLFSSFTTVLDLIKEECQKQGISYYILTGKTKKEERRELVNQFQKDDTTLFLISLKAGGTGLNLTAAEAVIHFDPWWNLSAQNQATDRAYRIGQKNNVQVFNLIMKDSVEEKILKLQEKKKDLADMFVEGNTGGLASLSKEDIVELFSMS